MARFYSTTEVVELLDEEMETEMDDEPSFEGSDDDLNLHLSDEEERLVHYYKNGIL